MKFLISTICFVVLFHELRAVNWNGNNWALRCDFPGNDLKSIRAQGEDCGSLCAQTSGCTHWAFNKENGGTCYLKQGSVSHANAVDSSDPSSSCGVNEASTNPTDKPVTDGPNKPTTGSALEKFTGCQFSYGTDWAGGNKDYSHYDYVSIWINTPADNCSGNHCTDFNEYYQGDMLKKVKSLNKIPVFYGYVIAFEARVQWGLQDCNVGYPSLCQRGSKFIRENRARIIERYDHHSSNFANIIGKGAFCVFLIEPDFWQYYGDHHSQEGGTVSGEGMRSLFDDIVSAIKKNLPNAAISWDISAWIKEDGFQTWWNFFKSSPHIDFLHTSGGEGRGDLAQFKPGELSWEFLSRVTGKRIIADAGYAVAGNPFDNRGPWYNSWNVDSRVSDGVASVTLANSNKNPSYKKSIC